MSFQKLYTWIFLIVAFVQISLIVLELISHSFAQYSSENVDNIVPPCTWSNYSRWESITLHRASKSPSLSYPISPRSTVHSLLTIFCSSPDTPDEASQSWLPWQLLETIWPSFISLWVSCPHLICLWPHTELSALWSAQFSTGELQESFRSE